MGNKSMPAIQGFSRITSQCTTTHPRGQEGVGIEGGYPSGIRSGNDMKGGGGEQGVAVSTHSYPSQ